MSEKALGMLKHMQKQIFGHPAPLRGGAWSGSQHRREPWRERMRWPSR
jgi:hypothetical protein